MSPSHEWLGYFQGKLRAAGNGHRDGRAPHSKLTRRRRREESQIFRPQFLV